MAQSLLFNIKKLIMALKRDVVKMERTVNGETQYKTIQALNLNSRKAREAYAAAGWKPSAGKVRPVGVPAPKAKKQKAVEVDEQPEINVQED